MHPRPRYSIARLTALLCPLALTFVSTFGCSDDKPAKSGQAQQSTGGEGTLDRVNRAHENFKQEIRPAAGWVDDRSHEVADEAVNAVNKGKKKLKGEGESAHGQGGDHDQAHADDPK